VRYFEQALSFVAAAFKYELVNANSLPRYPQGHIKTCYQECGCHLNATKEKLIRHCGGLRTLNFVITHASSRQELMSGEATKERVTSGSIQIQITYVFPFWKCAMHVMGSGTGASALKNKVSPNGEGSRDLQIYHVFVANRFHCHPFAWPFHCG